jgi:hypothetical protein
MTVKILSDADIRAMLGPMHSAYVDAVRDTELRRDMLERQLADARESERAAWAEVGRLNAALLEAHHVTDALAVRLTLLTDRHRRYEPGFDEGSQP